MRKSIFSLLFCLCALPVLAQNVRFDGVVQARSGAPAPGASVAVCTQPATTTTQPCTPLATLCSSLTDAVCVQPNPVTADGLGNYHFYVPTNKVPVTVQFYGSALTPSVLPDQYFGGTLATGTISGNLTFTGNITALAGQNTLNFYNHNGIVWVGQGAAYKYTTLEAALAAPECSANGCRIILVTGFRENVACTSSSVVIGSATQVPRILIEGQPDSVLVATGAGGGIPCFIVKDGSGFEGPVTGAGGVWPNRSGGFTISDNRTGSVGALITTDTADALGQSYFMLRDVFINGCFTFCTVTPAIVDLEQLLNQSVIENVKICCGSNTYEFQITSGPLHEVGPIVVQNLWTDCGAFTGCKNIIIKTGASSGSQAVLPVTILGGNQVAPGLNLPIITVDGSQGGAGGKALKGVSITTMLDDSSGAGASTGILLKDVYGANINVMMLGVDADTAVDISESAVTRTAGIHLSPVICISPTNGCKSVNNHISGEVITAVANPFYNFGSGDAGVILAASTVSNNKFTVSGDNDATTNFGFQLNDTHAGGNNWLFGETFGTGTLTFQNLTATGQPGFAFFTGSTVNAYTRFVHNNTASRDDYLPDVAGTLAVSLNGNGTTHGVTQSKRGTAGCTTGAAAGNNCAAAITVTWTTSFADTNYSVICTGQGTATNSPSGPYVVSKANGSVVVNYFTITAAAASYPTVDCEATHD